MDTHRLLIKLSTRILLQFAMALILVIAAIIVNLDFLTHTSSSKTNHISKEIEEMGSNPQRHLHYG